MRSQGMLGSILIAVAIIIFFVLIMPLYDEIKVVRQAIDERTVMLSNLEDALLKVKKLQMDMDNNGGDVEKAGRIITGPKNSDEILVILETIANDSGIKLSGIKMGQEKSEGKYQVIILNIDGMSTYFSIQSFLAKMEKSTRLFDVTNLDMTESANGVRFVLKAKVYYLE